MQNSKFLVQEQNFQKNCSMDQILAKYNLRTGPDRTNGPEEGLVRGYKRGTGPNELRTASLWHVA